jgi:hypothetical protein
MTSFYALLCLTSFFFLLCFCLFLRNISFSVFCLRIDVIAFCFVFPILFAFNNFIWLGFYYCRVKAWVWTKRIWGCFLVAYFSSKDLTTGEWDKIHQQFQHSQCAPASIHPKEFTISQDDTGFPGDDAFLHLQMKLMCPDPKSEKTWKWSNIFLHTWGAPPALPGSIFYKVLVGSKIYYL